MSTVERKLQQELQKIKSLSGNSDTLMEGLGTQTDELTGSMLGQHDRLTPLSGQTGQEIRRRKISREGRYKGIDADVKLFCFYHLIFILTKRSRYICRTYLRYPIHLVQ